MIIGVIDHDSWPNQRLLVQSADVDRWLRVAQAGREAGVETQVFLVDAVN